MPPGPVVVPCPNCRRGVTVPGDSITILIAAGGVGIWSFTCPECREATSFRLCSALLWFLRGHGARVLDAPVEALPSARGSLTEDDLISFGQALGQCGDVAAAAAGG